MLRLTPRQVRCMASTPSPIMGRLFCASSQARPASRKPGGELAEPKMGKYEATYTFLKQHPYRIREALKFGNISKSTGITAWNLPLILYALLISIQLRRKVSFRAAQTCA